MRGHVYRCRHGKPVEFCPVCTGQVQPSTTKVASHEVTFVEGEIAKVKSFRYLGSAVLFAQQFGETVAARIGDDVFQVSPDGSTVKV